jgi:hypothetical protein
MAVVPARIASRPVVVVAGTIPPGIIIVAMGVVAVAITVAVVVVPVVAPTSTVVDKLTDRRTDDRTA